MENQNYSPESSRLPLILSIVSIVLVLIVGGVLYVVNSMAVSSLDTEMKANQDVLESRLDNILEEIKNEDEVIEDTSMNDGALPADLPTIVQDKTTDVKGVDYEGAVFVDAIEGLRVANWGNTDCDKYLEVEKKVLGIQTYYNVNTKNVTSPGQWYSYVIMMKDDYNNLSKDMPNPPKFQRNIGSDRVLLMNSPLDFPEGLPDYCSTDSLRFYDL